MGKRVPLVKLLLGLMAMSLVVAACGGGPANSPTNAGPSTGVSAAKSSPPSAPAQTPAPAPSAPAPLKPLDPPVEVKIADDGFASGAAYYIAAERGYFKELGINIQWITFQRSTDIMGALATNELQLAGGPLGLGLFNAVSRGIDVKVAADKGMNYPGRSYFSPVIRKDLEGQIKEIKDLKGRKIAVLNLQDDNEMFLREYLRKGNLKLEDVQPVILAAPEMLAALANKSIDAAAAIEPFITLGEGQGTLVRFKDMYDVIGPTQNAVILASSAFMKNTEVAGRWMVAYIRGARDYNEAFFGSGKDRAALTEILIKRTTLKDPVLWTKVALTGLSPNGYVLNDAIAKNLASYRELGYFTGKLELDQLIDHSAVDFAIKYLGKK